MIIVPANVMDMPQRLENLKAAMVEDGYDAFLVTNPFNVYYLVGFMGGYLVLPLDSEPRLLTSALLYDDAVERVKGCQVLKVRMRERALRAAVDQLQELHSRRVLYDALEAPDYLTLTDWLKGVELKDGKGYVWKLRMLKERDELQSMRKAAALASSGMHVAYENLRPGIREYTVAAEAEYVMRKEGSEGTPFKTIVASGPRSALPHAEASDRIVQEDDVVIVDLGAAVGGYTSDLTRTFIMGKPSERQASILRSVQEAQLKALASLKAGLACKEAYTLARKVLEREGLEEGFIHALGHGVGLEIHEPPRLSLESQEILQEGNVVTVEPGVYMPGYWGFRWEDMVLIVDDGYEQLTYKFPEQP